MSLRLKTTLLDLQKLTASKDNMPIMSFKKHLKISIIIYR